VETSIITEAAPNDEGTGTVSNDASRFVPSAEADSVIVSGFSGTYSLP